MFYYIVITIGCLECRYNSELKGIFTDKTKAEAVKAKFTANESSYNADEQTILFEVAEEYLNKELELISEDQD